MTASPIKASVALVAALAFGCTSSTDLVNISTQLNDIQVQLLQAEKRTPSHDDLAATRAALEENLLELVRAHAETRNELSRISSDVQSLAAELEETNFRLTQLSQQITATNQELQEIRRAAEAQARRPVVPPTVVASDPQELYDSAYNDYVEGNYDLAILGFRRYVEEHDDTELADNATYWIGECFYRQSKFEKAIRQFDTVITGYENSDRIASSLLKKSYAYLGLGQRDEGVADLQQVICEYSGTDEAHLARQKLLDLEIEPQCR